MIGRRRASMAIAFAAAALLGFAPVARADNGTPGYVGGFKLVWGSVAVPDFGSRFGLPASIADGPALEESGYAMALTLPDSAGQQFLFSPRLPQVMPEAHGGGGQRAYLGFSFDIGEPTGIYGSVAVGGSVASPHVPGLDDGGPRTLNAPLLLHGGLELGYRLDTQNTFALSIDRAAPSDSLERGSGIGNFRLRYGLKF
jgi:hypothetical protein